MRHALFALTLLLASTAPAFAGVVVVDPANGPGTDFTSLDLAIAAASSGDVLLLRSGTYDGSFVVSGKTLSIIADEGATVTITNSATGNPDLPALQLGSDSAATAVVRGLNLTTPAGGGVPLVVSGTSIAGAFLFLEECKVPTTAGAGMRIANGSPAIMSRCEASGADGDPAPGPDGFPLTQGGPALVAGAGPLAIFGGLYVGGEGLDAGVYGPPQVPTPGQDGESGMVSQNTDNSVKVLAGALFIGGLGGNGAKPGATCLDPGDGGNGILATAGGNVKLAGTFGVGDLPGTPAPGCPQTGVQGGLIAAIPPAQLPVFLNAHPVSLVATRVAREGHAATLTVSDAGDQQVTLLIGFAPVFTYAPNLNGALVVMPTLVFSLGTLPFPGTQSIHTTIPELGPGIESMFAFAQALSKDSLGRKTLGMATVTLMLDSSF